MIFNQSLQYQKRLLTEKRLELNLLIEKRRLMDGREFSVYKKYFTEEEIIEIFTKYGFEVKEFCLGHNFFGIRGELK